MQVSAKGVFRLMQSVHVSFRWQMLVFNENALVYFANNKKLIEIKKNRVRQSAQFDAKFKFKDKDKAMTNWLTSLIILLFSPFFLQAFLTLILALDKHTHTHTHRHQLSVHYCSLLLKSYLFSLGFFICSIMCLLIKRRAQVGGEEEVWFIWFTI